MTIKEMREKRARLVQEARTLIDKAKEEKRDLDNVQYDKIMGEVDSLKVDIDREERMAGLQAELGQSQGLQTEPGAAASTSTSKTKNIRSTDEYKEAFWKGMTRGKDELTLEQRDILFNHPEVRSLNIGSQEAGGYTVPDEFERNFIPLLEENNVMRQLGNVITTSSGERTIPIEADRGEAYWIGEEELYKESDARFSTRSISAHKLTRLMKISEELLNDSAFDMEQYISGNFAYTMGEKEELAMINGDGEGKPTGVLQEATAGKTTAFSDIITFDDIMDLFYSVKRNYRSRASYLLGEETVKALRKLKDANGQYIWVPSVNAGQADTIFGRPTVVSDHMTSFSAGSKAIAFGDFNNYWIADRQGRSFQRLNELYATRGQVGFRMFQRVDGRLIVPESVKTLTLGADVSGANTAE